MKYTKWMYGIGVLIFFSFMIALFILTLIKVDNPPAPLQSNTSSSQQLHNALNASEVAKHTISADCWVIISDKVYNVSGFNKLHPGGSAAITDWCGKDATSAFANKGSLNQPHSAKAQQMLSSFLLANLIATPVNNPQAQNLSHAPKKDDSLSRSVVSLHNLRKDCWLIINNAVYDVTDYISIHPGGELMILRNCGKDATDEFLTKGGSKNTHSDFAIDLLSDFFLGNLNVSEATAIIPQVPVLPNITIPDKTLLKLSMAEVARHSRSSDCWLVIDGYIYDVSSYINEHPGGAAIIRTNCGTDATQAFDTKAGAGSHSDFAINLLQALKIGVVDNYIAPVVNNTPVVNTTNPTTQLTMAELAKHSSRSDCWLLISGKVYDVTSFINIHPGGITTITNSCGQESTAAFDSRGGSGSHSSNARNMLANYLVGALNSNATTTPGSSGSAASNTVTITSSGQISPQSLTIMQGTKITFKYTNPGDEVILTFSPQPPNSMKLDHEHTTSSYTFNNEGTYNYHASVGGTQAKIIVVEEDD